MSDGPYSFYIKVALLFSCLTVVTKSLSLLAGGSVAVSDKASFYGELSAMTGDELSVGTKLGMKYSF